MNIQPIKYYDIETSGSGGEPKPALFRAVKASERLPEKDSTYYVGWVDQFQDGEYIQIMGASMYNSEKKEFDEMENGIEGAQPDFWLEPINTQSYKDVAVLIAHEFAAQEEVEKATAGMRERLKKVLDDYTDERSNIVNEFLTNTFVDELKHLLTTK